MQTQITDHPHTIVIVLNDDGTIKGAHQERLEIMSFPGTDREEQRRMLPAQPLAEDTLRSVIDSADTVGQLAAALETIAALEARAEALAEEVAGLRA